MDRLELLRRLVAFDSTSRRGNREIARWVADLLGQAGATVWLDPAGDGERFNVLATIGPEADSTRQGLTLSGHLDVVPADEPEWTSDPFTLVESDDRLIGRGACDMKGFVALAVAALCDTDPATLCHPLGLVLTYDEEIGTRGARHLAERRPHLERLPKQVIVGEPTSLRAVRMHKGHTGHRLTVRGRPAHSGFPHLGHNAITPLARAIVALDQLRQDLEHEPAPNAEHFDDTPYVALNLATISGGAAVNVIPDRATLDLGFRVLPGQDPTAVDRRIREVLEATLDGEDWNLEELHRAPPMEPPADHAFHRRFLELLGQEASRAVAYATDGGWLASAGFDCLIWGPGDIAVAHQPNEWLAMHQFEQAETLLDQAVRRLCG